MDLRTIQAMSIEELIALKVEKIIALGKKCVEDVHSFLDKKIKSIQHDRIICSSVRSHLKKIKLSLKTHLATGCPA